MQLSMCSIDLTGDNKTIKIPITEEGHGSSTTDSGSTA